jgi:hypothetical protein
MQDAIIPESFSLVSIHQFDNEENWWNEFWRFWNGKRTLTRLCWLFVARFGKVWQGCGCGCMDEGREGLNEC